jgi:tRNA (cmo5U34)-methyltransferase
MTKSNAFGAYASSSYLEGPPRQVPGFESLHRMVSQLLAETMPENGRLLVLGAGGGLELKALAEAHPGWGFVGIDPSASMLELARQTASGSLDRIALHEAYIDAAPEGPFDGAISLLTFHFIPPAERLETLRQLHLRLKPGAPLLLAHISFSQAEPERSQWIDRHVAYSAPSGTSPEQMAASREAIGTRLTILAPAEEEANLASAGFKGVALFYSGLSFRGWLAYAG